VTEEQPDSDVNRPPNNPAGRVLLFLREFEVWASSALDDFSATATIKDLLNDEEQESSRMYLQLTRLRMQAESVPDLMKPYADDFGYRTIFEHYPQILDATKRLQTPAGQKVMDILHNVNEGGWLALEYADAVLSHHSSEVPISQDLQKTYLDQVRALIGEVVGDDTLSPSDQSRIVDLLRKVEQALLDVWINGSLPVQEAAAAAGAIVRLSPSLWERIKSRPWVKDFATVLFAICMALEGTANGLAIEQYFSDEPQEVVVVVQQDEQQREDQQDRHDQPTEQPTPR
jgi:hypothetical protein